MKEFENEVIITVVNKGYSDYVIDAAREGGAGGGTVVSARGANKGETDTFLGITIQPEKEIVLTIVPNKNKDKIMKAISTKINIKDAGKGICFSLPVSRVIGIPGIKNTQKKDD